MRESVFQGEITRSVKELLPGWHYFKIPDAPIYGSESTFKRRPIVKPYDCFLTKNGIFIAIECKMHKSLNSWSFDALNPNQEEGLSSVINSGGKAGILLNIRNNKLPEKHENKLGKSSINAMVWISIKLWKVFREKVFDDRKSIPIDYLLGSLKKCKLFGIYNRVRLPSGQYGWEIDKLVDVLNKSQVNR